MRCLRYAKGRRRAALMGALLCLLVLGSGAQGAPVVKNDPAQSAGPAGTIRILPFPAHASPGGTVTVDVWLEGGTNYYGIDVRLYFDTARLQATATQVTPIWEVFDENNHFIIKNQVNNSTGEIWYAVTNTNPAEPFTGMGRIFSVTFVGAEPGAAVLDFYYVKGSTRDGDALYPTQVDGAILVGSAYRLHLPVVQAGP